MKQRVITGLIIAAVMIPCAVFMHTIAFAIMTAVISAVSVYELQTAAGNKNKVMIFLSCAVGAAIPFAFEFRLRFAVLPAAAIMTVAYLIIMVVMHKKTTFNDTVTSLFAAVCIPSALSMMLTLRDVYITFPDHYDKAHGVYLIIFAYISAWATDIFALLTGRKLGKHKLSPNISPKKTVEGAIGGVLGAIALNTVLWLIFNRFWFESLHFTIWHSIIITIILAVISMFGDLACSVIKRNHGIKDFGKILPGHGGFMDRFDSMLFVLPTLYAAVYILNAGFNPQA